MTSDNTGKKQKASLFKPGQSGNPKGRPKGAKNKLGEDFLNDIHDLWKLNGKDYLVSMAERNPGEFVRVVASVLPKEITVDGDIKHAHIEEPVSNTLEWLAEAIRSNTEDKKSLLN